jgi:hypothetical protein
MLECDRGATETKEASVVAQRVKRVIPFSKLHWEERVNECGCGCAMSD